MNSVGLLIGSGVDVNEARHRQRTRKSKRPDAKPKPSEPAEQKVVLYVAVVKFIDGLPENKKNSALDKINSLKDPLNRRVSKKIKGTPKDDPIFRIEIRPYRALWKRVGRNVHVIDMKHRKDIYK